LAVYGIYRDADSREWVLTGLSLREEVEKMAHDSRRKRSRIEVRSKHVLLSSRRNSLAKSGIEIERFDTKKAAMSKVSADSSEKADTGEYLVRMSHSPRSFQVEVDRDEYREFQNRALRVRD